MSDPIIPRKWKLSAHGQQNVFVWGRRERSVHTLMKAFIWALYLPQYPDLVVEVHADDPRYKPDVVATDPTPNIYTANPDPLFWGEAGQVGKEKLETLVARYPSTHFALAKWDTSLRPVVSLVEDALAAVERTAPFDLITFPPDSKTRFITESGSITVDFDLLDWHRL
jgi:hypothetical protein